mgnify:FL=1
MLKKEYIKLKENGDKETHLCVEMDYSLGGTNWYNHTPIPRGYYLYVTPCTLEDRGTYQTVSQVLGKGLKILLKQVARRSKKAEDTAIQIAQERKAELIAAVCKEYGYEVEE